MYKCCKNVYYNHKNIILKYTVSYNTLLNVDIINQNYSRWIVEENA